MTLHTQWKLLQQLLRKLGDMSLHAQWKLLEQLPRKLLRKLTNLLDDEV